MNAPRTKFGLRSREELVSMSQSENDIDRTPPPRTYDINTLARLNDNTRQGKQNQLQPASKTANTEPNGTLYILTPVQKTKPPAIPQKAQTQSPPQSRRPQPTQTALVPAVQTAAGYPQAIPNTRNTRNTRNTQNNINNINKNINHKKIPSVKSLISKFRKNGLGIIDSYFNAYYFYYEWKSEKKGRRPKEYLKTVARHPKGWAKKSNDAVYEKNIYDKYLSVLAGIAKLSGAISSVFAPVGKFFGGLKNLTKSKTSANIAHITRKVCQLVLPVAVAACTFMAITNINSFKPRLELILNGQEIGFVASKETVEKAVGQLEQTVSSVLNEPYEFTGIISYKIILSKTSAYVSANDIYDIMYHSSQNAITSAYGLYIDGELVGAAQTEDDINLVLSAVLDEIAEKTEGDNVEFANDIKIIEDQYAVRDVVTQDELKTIMTYSAENPDNNQNDPNPENLLFSSYTVDSKKYLYEIADSDVPLANGAVYENGGFSDSSNSSEFFESSLGAEDRAVIAAATSLDLTPESINTIPRGFLESVADSDETGAQAGGIFSRISKAAGNKAASALQVKHTEIEIYTKTLPFDVKYVESANYYTGTQIVQKNGVNGEEKITADVTYIGGAEVSREIIGIETVKEPVSKIVVIGIKPKPLPGPTGGFIRPVKGGYISTRFGGGHRGADLVVPFGTPVHAADGGTVIYTGFSGSYGNHVKIRHSDGFVSVYAHLSSIGVKNGEKVFQGQEIGKVGSTGNSSGNHLHFEIIKNGVLVNPESYMK